MKGKEHEPKTLHFLYATRDKHQPEYTAESNKYGGSRNGVKDRKKQFRWTGVYTKDQGTTYLYLANTWEVGHGSMYSEGVVWWWGEREGLFWGSRSNFFGERCPAGMTSHQKEVNMGLDHLMHAIKVGNEEVWSLSR